MNHDYNEYLFISIAQCKFEHTLPTPKAVFVTICSSLQLQCRNVPPSFKGQDLHTGSRSQTLQPSRNSINKPLFLQHHKPSSSSPSSFKVSFTWESGENTSSFSYCPLPLGPCTAKSLKVRHLASASSSHALCNPLQSGIFLH